VYCTVILERTLDTRSAARFLRDGSFVVLLFCFFFFFFFFFFGFEDGLGRGVCEVRGFGAFGSASKRTR